MKKNIIEDMQEKTLEYKRLFNKDNPMFTVAIPNIKKMSFISGYDTLKELFKEQDPNTIDLRARDFTILKDGVASGTQEVWTIEFDGEPVYILRNGKVMNRGQFVSILRRIKFAN